MTAAKHPLPDLGPSVRALNTVGHKWVLVIVQVLGAQNDGKGGPLRFVALHHAIGTISVESLRTRLNSMVEDGLLTRTRYREVPPRVDYELTAKGKGLFTVLLELSMWQLAWNEPATEEEPADG